MKVDGEIIRNLKEALVHFYQNEKLGSLKYKFVSYFSVSLMNFFSFRGKKLRQKEKLRAICFLVRRCLL